MSESSPFIIGGMAKTGGFEDCPNRGGNRRKKETKIKSCFTWVMF